MEKEKLQLIEELKALVIGLCGFYDANENRLPDYVVILLCQQIENLIEIVEDLEKGKERYEFFKQIITHAISELLVTFDGYVIPNLQDAYAQINAYNHQFDARNIRLKVLTSSHLR